jgi:hypothetical protein
MALKWVVHEEIISNLKGTKKADPVYYLRYNRISYGTTLNKEYALELVDKYNKED